MYQHYNLDAFYYPVHELHQPSIRQKKPTRVKQVMKQLTNPDTINRGVNGLSRTLGSAEQVIKVVQSTTPYIEEYAPVVKNLPAMFRLVRAFNKISKMDDSSSDNPINNQEHSNHMNDQYSQDVSKPTLFI